MTFPYDVLITGAATLIAGVSGGAGGSWLAGRQSDRRDKWHRRLSAYSDFMTGLDDLIRTFGAYETFGRPAEGETLGSAVNSAVGTIHGAYAVVYLLGSKDVQPIAGKAWRAAWDIHDWFNPPNKSTKRPAEQLAELVVYLKTASRDFADAARLEVA